MFDVFRQPIPGWRRGETKWVNGRPVRPHVEAISIMASVQPASGKQLERLPEGKRTNPTMTLRSDSLMRGAVAGSHDSDVFEFSGRRWEVIAAYPWQNGIISHYEALVQGSQYDPDSPSDI